ncbi:Uncharacterised protein [Actinomyces bovis]|uniref:Uncharacterized protein n=1 Tax=Actinomyces bovis TaxID=1658 RepID=A0ABY1VNV7_9ACTO|nr:hypothetical protein [Actinomyces bovis]SPT53092.1 Uncharacterised protein [Actinomyces bovis]SPT53809.1 Uncharacterised protein [Actinomyces bovis]VEG53172.1 Uncharacterised protein [Actinomyces israelii]
MRRWSWPRTARWAWGTLVPPRILSLLAASAYACLAIGMTAAIIAPTVVSEPSSKIGAGVATFGALAAAPSAWRGWWGVEAPAAAIVTVGLSALAASGLLHGDDWPSWGIWLILGVVLGLLQRVIRIWGIRWQPGQEPETSLRATERRLQVVRAISADVLAAQAEGVTRGGAG